MGISDVINMGADVYSFFKDNSHKNVIFNAPGYKIDGFELTVAISVLRDMTNEVTSNPVETGVVVIDNLIAMPEIIVVEGAVAAYNSYLGGLISAGGAAGEAAEAISSAFGGKESFTTDLVRTGLIELRGLALGRPFALRTSVGNIDNLVVKNLKFSDDVDQGDTLKFRLACQRVLMALPSNAEINPGKGNESLKPPVGGGGHSQGSFIG